jgi:hypothetical protein
MALAIVKKVIYPILVGLMLGLLQTGLFFQLTSTLSSGFGTYLMITLCWLVGSALGVLGGAKFPLKMAPLLLVAFASYGVCGLLLSRFPFETGLWPVYGVLVALIGTYPGLFFASMSSAYRARSLFLLENNGFILGLVAGTLLLLLAGRTALWITPALVGLAVLLLRAPVSGSLSTAP